MKISLHQIAAVICLIATAGLTTGQAQDATTQEFEITETERERYERDKIIFSPGGESETRYVGPRTQPTGSSSPNPKDSVSSAPATKPAAILPSTRKEASGKNPTKQIPPKQDDDAILTFNFLYYIIQKYKLQEIIQ
ncbi:MAG TPA: hypothetical protein VGD40_03170 [Chryseosolibacter sp.]